MSIFAVWAGKDSALAMVDSHGVSIDDPGESSSMSKMVPLVAAKTLVIHRGSSLHFGFVFLRLLSGVKPHGSFDELMEIVPDALAELPEFFPKPSYGGGEAELELVLVGWSDKLQGMALCISRYKHGEAPTIGSPCTGTGAIVPIAPQDMERAQNAPFEAAADVVEAMRSLAREMVAFGRQNDERGENGFGGNLIIAQLAPARMTLMDCGPIGA